MGRRASSISSSRGASRSDLRSCAAGLAARRNVGRPRGRQQGDLARIFAGFGFDRLLAPGGTAGDAGVRGVRRHRGVPGRTGGRRRRGRREPRRAPWEQRRPPPRRTRGAVSPGFSRASGSIGCSGAASGAGSAGAGSACGALNSRSARHSERRAGVAQERVEGARVVAVADQREPEVATAERAMHLACEQLGLDALGALEPPGGPRDAASQQALERAFGRQLVHERRLERVELARSRCRRRGPARARRRQSTRL